MEIQPFSYLTRQKNLERLQQERFDLCVIGGGITGAGIAYDAALRGIKTCLVEKADFANGTSSKSARMIHGGLRYLQQYQFGLVRQGVKERNRLLRLAPRIVKPISFIYPIYDDYQFSYFVIAAGMWFYDFLSLYQNPTLHKSLSAKHVRQHEPQIKHKGLTGAVQYYDCIADDARLTLAVIHMAHRYGANVNNYLNVVKMITTSDQVSGVAVQDVISGEMFPIKAEFVVNATGVWCDDVRQMDNRDATKIIRANRGIHLVVSRKQLPINHAIAFVGIDGERALYALPWQNTCILGTTDVDHQHDFDDVTASMPEVNFIMDSVNNMFPDANITMQDIITTFAGLRPLLKTEESSAYGVSREHEIYISKQQLISVVGGKLTTHRHMAQDAVDIVAKMLFRKYRNDKILRCRTRKVPIAQEEFDLTESALDELCQQIKVSPESIHHLFDMYGFGYKKIVEMITEDAKLARNIIPELPYLWAEVIYVIKFEMALTVQDVMIRRLHIFYETKGQGLDVVESVAALMQQHLGWDDEKTKQEVLSYQQYQSLEGQNLEGQSKL